MPLSEKKQKKLDYTNRVAKLLEVYNKVLIISIDNVGASMIQSMRQQLRGKAVLLFGKNSLIRRAFRQFVEKVNKAGNKESAKIETLIPYLRGNIGLVFSNEDLSEVADVIVSYKQEAPAKVGSLAPEDVFVDPGPTGMEPTQTQFLQALNIASKIVKGQVEIVSRIHLIKKGEKVGSSEATLLDKLNIRPFNYQAVVNTVYDSGFVYDAELLSLGKGDVLAQLAKAVQRIASIGLEIGIPSIATIPHYIATGYKNIVAISVETDYEFEGSKDIKAYLKDPSAFAVAAPAQGGDAKQEDAAPAEEEPEEESQSIGGLFGSDDSDF